MGKLSEKQKAEACQMVEGHTWASRRVIIADLAAAYAVSEATIYRAVGGTGRKRRADAGKRKALSPEIFDWMAGLTLKADMSGHHVVQLAARQFDLPHDFISVAQYNALLRRRNLSRRAIKADLTPARRFEAQKANDLWHYDTTVAQAWYQNADGSIGYEPEARRNKNKPGNRRPRLQMFAGVDDHSRTLWARIYSSESSYNVLDFLRRCWQRSEDTRWPAFGLPVSVYADLGSPFHSRRVQSALKKMEIDVVPTTPSSGVVGRGGPRKHGKVERVFGEGILKEFQKITRVVQFPSLEALNEELNEWLIERNNRLHGATGQRPFQRWLRGIETPREAPISDLWQLFNFQVTTRVLSQDLRINLNGIRYQLHFTLPQINWVRHTVEVYYLPHNPQKISVVHDGHEIEAFAEDDVMLTAGQYKDVQKTAQAEEIERLKDNDYQDMALRSRQKTGVDYIVPKGEAFEDEKIATRTIRTDTGTRPSLAQDKKIPRFQAIVQLRARGLISSSRLTEEDQAIVHHLMRELPDVSQAVIDEFCDQFDDNFGKEEVRENDQ